jgi:hypothetical protein
MLINNASSYNSFVAPLGDSASARVDDTTGLSKKALNNEATAAVTQTQVSLGQPSVGPDTYSALANNPDKKASEDQQAVEQEKQDQQKIQELKERDTVVRIHEQAHAAVGGQYAGAPTYEYETGPNGKRYAVGGEVSIDVSEEKDPQDTISKMQVVRAAALAPAEPSTQDYKVAAQATQKEQAARAELAKQNVSGDSANKDNEGIVAYKNIQQYSSQNADKSASMVATSA